VVYLPQNLATNFLVSLLKLERYRSYIIWLSFCEIATSFLFRPSLVSTLQRVDDETESTQVCRPGRPIDKRNRNGRLGCLRLRTQQGNPVLRPQEAVQMRAAVTFIYRFRPAALWMAADEMGSTRLVFA
jgi:hypothetical protein